MKIDPDQHTYLSVNGTKHFEKCGKIDQIILLEALMIMATCLFKDK